MVGWGERVCVYVCTFAALTHCHTQSNPKPNPACPRTQGDQYDVREKGDAREVSRRGGPRGGWGLRGGGAEEGCAVRGL